MAKTISATVKTEAQLSYNQPHTLLEIVLDDSTTVYYTDNNESINWPTAGGDTYVPWGLNFSDIRSTLTGEIDRVDIELDNVDLTWTGYVNDYNLQENSVIIRRVFAGLLGSDENSIILFKGTISTPVIDERTCVLTIISLFQKFESPTPKRSYGNSCYWEFDGTECLQVGEPGTGLGNLVGYWVLSDEKYSGGVYLDDSANTNVGTPNNTPTFEKDRYGVTDGATYFNTGETTNDYISMASAVRTFFADADNFSIVISFKTDTIAGTTVLFSSTDAANDRVLIGIESGVLKVTFYDGAAYHSKSVAFTDTASWHIIIMTKTSAEVVNGYLDNVEMVGTSTPATNATEACYIGAKTDALENFNGKIAHVYVYDNILSTAKIRLHSGLQASLAGELTGQTVDAGCTTTVIIDGSRGEDDDTWNFGTIEFTSGNASGEKRMILDSIKNTSITVYKAFSVAPSNLDEYTIRTGCSKLSDMCKGIYDNFLNFGGFINAPWRAK